MGRLVTWLFVPGATERFMAKLPTAAPDVAVLDLEDGVAKEDRTVARGRIAGLLNAAPSGEARLAVRTNPVGSNAFEADLNALGPRLFALLLPKVGGAEEVKEAGGLLLERGLGEVMLVPMIESAQGLRNAFALLTAHEAVGGVAFGAEDLAADLGLGLDIPAESSGTSEARRTVLANARAELIISAAAAGVRVRVESPQLGLRDDAVVAEAAARARGYGFSGMFAVHPAQVGAIRHGFSPSVEEQAYAAAVAAAGAPGRAVSVSGRMVDEALVRQAARVLGEGG